MSETPIQSEIKLAIGSKRNVRIWRNNTGIASFPDGSKVKYGLCTGSSDLIGIKKIKVTRDMVGKEIGIFVAIEVKTPKGRKSKDQKNFIEVVKQFGGIAGFCSNKEEAEDLLK